MVFSLITSFPGPLLFPSPGAREEKGPGEGKRRGPGNEVVSLIG